MDECKVNLNRWQYRRPHLRAIQDTFQSVIPDNTKGSANGWFYNPVSIVEISFSPALHPTEIW
jgi:hypothetical protein